MNNYYENIKFVKEQLKKYLSEIYKVYWNELLLKLEDYNLLSDEDNCIETSTATGFIIEEFITSKLVIYTKNHKEYSDIKVIKLPKMATVKTSYDCFAIFKDIYFMINIKVEKETSNNNAVAAINILYDDYVVQNPEQEKSYIILKTHYNFGYSDIDNERKIKINSISCYALEEIDFSTGHIQDHRNWSKTFNKNSGRLQIPTKWLENKLLPYNEIAYLKTKNFIYNIYNNEND